MEICLFFIYVYSLASINCMKSTGTVTVKIQEGILRGTKYLTDEGKDYFSFFGIPYAKPPIGKLRFKAPEFPQPWHGEKDATAVNNRNVAIQMDLITKQISGSEDCLYLNVYTQKLNNSELMPVIINIHGGAFMIGSGTAQNPDDPEPLVELGVVFVKFNYRLSIFGFLSLGIPEAAGNMGLKDQIKAFQWVQNNIEIFGGDKNKVTLMGSSAGAASIEYHMLSPLSKGLYSKAILHSGSSLNHWAINYEPEKLIIKLLKQLGHIELESDRRAIFKYLSNIPAKDLISAAIHVTLNYTSESLFFGFVPTIEKDFEDGNAFLTMNPLLLIRAGNFRRIPIIKGFCHGEGYMAKMTIPSAFHNIIENKNFLRYLPYELNAKAIRKLNTSFERAYSNDMITYYENDAVALNFFGDADVIGGVWFTAQQMAKAGVPVFVYEFTFEGTLRYFERIFHIKTSWAAHIDDLPYVMSSELSWNKTNELDKLVRKRMLTMWSNFVKISNPTPNLDDEISTLWLPYTPSHPAYLRIDKDLGLIKKDYSPERMSIYKNIYNHMCL